MDQNQCFSIFGRMGKKNFPQIPYSLTESNKLIYVAIMFDVLQIVWMLNGENTNE